MASDNRTQYQKAYQQHYRKTHKQVSVSLAMPQYTAFKQRAAQENTKVSTLVRNMAVAYLQQETLVPASVEKELKDLTFLIRNIANNVNQMAHHSNTIQQMVDERAFLTEIQRLEEAVKDYTGAHFSSSS